MKYSVALLVLITLAISLLLLSPDTDNKQAEKPLTGLPWQIELLPDGHSRVFGITLGQSTLGDVVKQLGNDMQLAIIAAPGESGDLEMYYSRYSANIITGKLIFVAAMTPDTLLQLQERAFRDGGTRRYRLHPDDLPLAWQAPVKSIIFLPTINLDEEIAHNRFGIPAETIHSSDQEIHLLYPDKGLDFILNQDGKEILRYVAPRDFSLLRRQLSPIKELDTPPPH
jgi:hypothetical protein